jgi:hypothetical protein
MYAGARIVMPVIQRGGRLDVVVLWGDWSWS